MENIPLSSITTVVVGAIIAAVVIFGPLVIWIRRMGKLKTQEEKDSYGRRSVRFFVLILFAIIVIGFLIVAYFVRPQ